MSTRLEPLGTILIVEDNLFMAELLAEKLSHQEFGVLRARDGAEGLKTIEDGECNIVLLDLPLSGEIDGFDMITRIRKNHPADAMPIIVLLNRDDQNVIKKSIELGASGCLVKAQVSTDEIIKQISNIAQGKPAPAVKSESATEFKQSVEEKPTKKVVFEAPSQLKEKIDALLKMPEQEVSIINLVDGMLEYAFLARSSDIHLEPTEDEVYVRMRIDGMLHDMFNLPKSLHSGVITRIKVLGGMRTDEHQAAQDGRFKINLREPPREFDVRVSIVPTYYGENSVLRILAEQTKIKKIDDLTMSDADKNKVKNAIAKPYGMILATGPTGSGKTTTLYTILKAVNNRETQIITIEDPVEYSLEGIDQIQVNSRTGLTFANGLRAILRQDPNVIMVGEIRDEETASIAVNAALTGHKLLSTLHTNDAATTLPRLLDMGVEPFLVASTVNVAIGQRLVRMICQNCKESRRITDAEFKNLTEHLGAEIMDNHRDFFYGKGCVQCGQSGYFDRAGIYEVLEMNDFVREAIMRHADAGEIKKIAIKNGMSTLLEDGFQKALQGVTTIEEILRVIHE